MNVLIVEDEVLLSNIYRRTLEKAGYVVVLAKDGLDALEAVHEDQFSVILLDVLMPRMNGLSFLSKIRSEGNQTPVVLITSVNLRELEHLDVFDVVPKPITKERLLEAVASCTGTYRRLNEELDATMQTLSQYLCNGNQVASS